MRTKWFVMFANNVIRNMKFIAAIIRISERNIKSQKLNVLSVTKRSILLTNFTAIALRIGAVQKPSQQ